MTEQNNPQDQQPQRNWLDAFEDKIHEANAFDRLLRALADTVSGFAASVGSVIPVITAVVVASAYMLSGVPFIVSLGAATAEFVGMYIHHDYRNRALTWWGMWSITWPAPSWVSTSPARSSTWPTPPCMTRPWPTM